YENLFWAFLYNAFCIPLAIGLYGIEMKPVYGAAAMSLSSFCVCMNALRLNFVKIHDPSHDVKKRAKMSKKTNDKENNKMEVTIGIKGMMCPHCEARVKAALEAINGVEKANVSHVDERAVVTLSKALDENVLKEAVIAAGYEVI
ncbi:MAG: cation transporter, partial [Clostridia bacterium]|nr:cation transporter [Clostridia bacterium]